MWLVCSRHWRVLTSTGRERKCRCGFTLAKCSETLAEVWFMSRCSSVRDGAGLETSGPEREKDQPKRSSPDWSPLPEKEREGEREKERMEEETTKKMETGIEEEAKEQEMGGLREGNKRGKQRRKSGRKGRANFIRLLPKCRTSVFHQSFSFQGKKPSAQAA